MSLIKNGKTLAKSFNFYLQPRLFSSQVPVHKNTPQSDLSLESKIPIEKRSLTRGLSLNKFEKVKKFF